MLVAEDRIEDVEILKLAFSKANVNVPLRFVNNGHEVIEYLSGQGLFLIALGIRCLECSFSISYNILQVGDK